MKVILIWYLVVMSGAQGSGGRAFPIYSPPMPTQEECERVQRLMKQTSELEQTRCIQIIEVKK